MFIFSSYYFAMIPSACAYMYGQKAGRFATNYIAMTNLFGPVISYLILEVAFEKIGYINGYCITSGLSIIPLVVTFLMKFERIANERQ